MGVAAAEVGAGAAEVCTKTGGCGVWVGEGLVVELDARRAKGK